MMEQLQEKFNALKAEFSKQEKSVGAKLAEQEKNQNLIEAFKSELESLTKQANVKLESGQTLTADEYVNLKTACSDLSARVEYHIALGNDLTDSIYEEKEKLLSIQRELSVIRSEITAKTAEEKLKQFLEQNTVQLNEIASLLYFSGNFKPNDFDSNTMDENIADYLGKKITSAIDKNYLIDESLQISSQFLTGFILKTPGQKHRERINPEPKHGLEQLFQKMMGN